MTSGYTRAVNDLMREVDSMDDLATPRPWKSDDSGLGIYPVNGDQYGGPIIAQFHNKSGAIRNHKANAALIVKAVNAYDSLTAEVQNIREIIADKTYPNDAERLADIAACAERALKGASK